MCRTFHIYAILLVATFTACLLTRFLKPLLWDNAVIAYLAAFMLVWTFCCCVVAFIDRELPLRERVRGVVIISLGGGILVSMSFAIGLVLDLLGRLLLDRLF